MNKAIYHICWASWIFGIVLFIISFIISVNPNDRYFIYLAVFFLVIHLVGFVGVMKHQNDTTVQEAKQ